jgi:hypothetical protein
VSAPAGARIVPAGRQRAAALHVLTGPCIRERASRFVSNAGQVDWLGLEHAAGLWSWDQWLLVAAAHDLQDGTATAVLRRLCATLEVGDLRRVLEAICILRPDATPTPEQAQ